MSLNRQTKAYWRRVTSLAKAIRWPTPKLNAQGHHYLPDIEEIFRDHSPGAPRSLLDDALAAALKDAEESIESAARFTDRSRELLSELQARIVEHRKPRFRLVGGAA